MLVTMFSNHSFTMTRTVQASQVEAEPELTLETEELTTENVVEDITGNIDGVEEVASVTYQVIAKDDTVTAQGEAVISGDTFTAEQIKLQDGENKVVFTVEDQSGNTTTKEMQVTYDAGELAEIPEKNIVEDASGVKYVNNTLLVTFHLDTTQERREEIISSINGTVIGQINAIKCYQVQVETKDMEQLQQMGDALKKAYPDDVMSATVDTIQQAQIYIPNDPYGSKQDWTEDVPSGNNWGFEAVQMASAWEIAQPFLNPVTGRFTNVTTGVVDDGFDLDHEDIGHVVYSSHAFTKEMIPESHGSHTSGIVGATWNNGKGIAGVCPSDMVLISADDEDRNLLSSNLKLALVEAVTKGAKTINYSIGSVYPYTGNAMETANMIAALYKQGFDFIYVQAAGNSSYDALYSGTFCSITEKIAKECAQNYGITAEDILGRKMVVAAIGMTGNGKYKLAKFSNYGTQIDIGAPGEDIYSLIGDGTYEAASGTSMAAPFVTGIAGFVWGINSELTGPQVKKIVCDASNSKVSVEDRDGNKIALINAKLCAEAAYKTAFKIESSKVGDGNKKKYSLGENIALSIQAPGAKAYAFQVKTQETEEVVYETGAISGNKASWTPKKVGEYKVLFTAYHENGCELYNLVENIFVETTTEKALTIEAFEVDHEQVSIAGETLMSVEAKGGVAPYTYRFGTIFNGEKYYSNGVYVSEDAAGEYYDVKQVLFQPRNLFANATDAIGEHTLFVQVKDAEGRVKTAKLKQYQVEGLEISEIKTSVSQPQKVNTTINLMAVVNNDGLALGGTETFTITRNKEEAKVYTVENDTHSYQWTPTQAGYYTITYSLEDALGQKGEITKKYRIVNQVEEGFEISSSISLGIKYSFTVSISVTDGGAAPYTYEVTCEHEDGTSYEGNVYANETYEKQAMASFGVDQPGLYYVTTTVTDANGNQVQVVETIEFGEASYTVTTDLPSPQKLGTPIRFTAHPVNMPNASRYNYTVYFIMKDGEIIEQLDYTCSHTGVWTPKEEGNYKVFAYFRDAGYEVGTAVLEYEILYQPNQVIYFDNSAAKWQNVYAYAWNNNSDAKVFNSVRIEENIYRIHILGSYNKILFKNTDGLSSWNLQTNDLTMPTTNNNCYKPSSGANKASGYWYPYVVVTPTPPVTTPPVTTPPVTTPPVTTPPVTTPPVTTPPVTTPPVTTPPVTTPPVTKNETVVYYQAPSSWTNVYIHYNVNGVWTNVPGAKMEASSAMDGYNYKYVIDLGKTTSTQVCFNNGTGSWDSRNAQNYKLEAGVYGIKNQVIEKLTMDMTASVKLSGEKGNVKATVAVENGTMPYSYQYSYTRNGAEEKTGSTNSSVFNLSAYKSGTYKVVVTVTDAEGKTATATDTLVLAPLTLTLESDAASTVKVGTTINFKANIKNDYYYYTSNYTYFNVYKDGEVVGGYTGVGRSYSFTPTEEGNYQVVCEFTDAAGEYAKDTLSFTVKNNANETVVYYKNNSWSTAYIHYSVNGKWTSVPGVRMQSSDRSGYTWKYVIDLGTATSTQVCFNNGTGSWDSKNSANYQLKAGTYGISSQTITTIK